MRFQRTSRIFCALLAGGLAGGVSSSGSEALAQTTDGIAVVATNAAPGLAPLVETPPYAAPPAPEPVLSAEAAAFRAALRAEMGGLSDADRVAVEGFYADRDFQPYWTAAGSASPRVLIAALEASAGQGLPSARYDPAGLAALFSAEGTPPGRAEVAATRAYLLYGGDLGAGVLRPSKIDPEIAVRPSRPPAEALLAKLQDQPLDAVLVELAPRDPRYGALIAERGRLEALALSDAWGPAVASGPTLHEGETGPRVAALRARLARLGYGAPSGEVAQAMFDRSLVGSVRAFQRDHGLNEDGAVGQHTLSEINTSARDRLSQVLVNLERMRWQGAGFGSRYVIVNIPDYSVVVYEGDAPVWRTKAVVGEAHKTQTAEFSDVMSYMVINPSWHVPSSIAKRVYLPKLRKDPGVLARSNMQLMTPAGTVINPALVDFAALEGSFPFRIRQSPSDGNALGKVKFIFPNDFSIYLHDTPHRELFAKDARAFSNGCVRVEDPDELAALLLRGQVDDPEARFDAWVAAKSERTVTLDNPIPVHIVYRTAFVDDAGVVRYRDDVYGRDAEVLGALEAAGVTLPEARG